MMPYDNDEMPFRSVPGYEWDPAGGIRPIRVPVADQPVDASEAEYAVRQLLFFIGEDVERDGLRDTPKRVAKALAELTAGYQVDIAKLLSVTFAEHHDQLIVVTPIPFESLCEHHMLPFHGVAHVGYIPSAGIVGLSKIARLVDAYARRLQVQERLTTQIADALNDHLHPVAVGVLIEATHTCMSMRGARRQANMVTSKLTGMLRERPDLRSEFFGLCHRATP
jgi:GTP cyclohydrolase I